MDFSVPLLIFASEELKTSLLTSLFLSLGSFKFCDSDLCWIPASAVTLFLNTN